jgi:hypothetical protein
LKRKAIYKGSDLGKDYGWNAMKDRFSDRVELTQTSENTIGEKPIVADKAQIFSKLATLYSDFRKHPTKGAFFESTFINKLDRVDLTNPLMKAFLDLTRPQAESVVNQFTSDKRKKLTEILEKEKGYFTIQAQTALQFLARAPEAAPSDKVQFLASYSMLLRKDDNSWCLQHMRGDHLRHPLSQAVAQNLEEGLLAGGPRQDVGYSKVEKVFIAGVAAGKPDVKNFQPDTFNHQHFKKLLSEGDYQKVTQDLTRNYINRLAIEAVKGGPREVVELLRTRGVLIVPVREGGKPKDYRVEYYQFPKSGLAITNGLRQGLLAIGYNEEPAAVTARYITMVGIMQGIDRKAPKAIDRALSYLEGRNGELHNSLTEALSPLQKHYEAANGKERDGMLERMGQLVIDQLGRYPSDNLLVQQTQEHKTEKSYDLEKGQKEGFVPAMDISSSRNAEVGWAASNRKRKKKKRQQSH